LEPILEAENITKQYRSNGLGRARHAVDVLHGVSLAVYPRTTLALVGPSGCGKSTFALCLALLERVTSGTIRFEGTETTDLSEEQRRAVRPKIQLVFQDPANSLNPRFSALQVVAEPLNIQQRWMQKEERADRAREFLERVGIPSANVHRQPHEFSGGQRQRIAIARALVLNPTVVILDEALSALDCSVQAQIVNLLLELQASLGLTYIFITHDLAMAAHVADDIAVMHRGTIVENGAAQSVMNAPQHEVTQRLLAASKFPATSLVPVVL
jgi:ABC-type glutathione transport system ATPase component